MSLNQLGLGLVFTAKDLASGVMQRVKNTFMDMEDRATSATKAFNSNFAQFGRGIAVMGAGLAVLGGAFALSNTAAKFEQALAGVAAVSGASADELKQLHDAAIEAGIATQYSPIEATVGLRELAQAGYNAHESMQLLIPVLDLADGSLGELTPQSAAGLAAQALKAFGLETSQASMAVDQMLQAVNVFALGAGELPLALGVASRGAQTLNQSLSETLVALGLVKNIIPTVERASTATAVAMERLANPKTQQQLAAIGVAVTDAHGRFRPFLDIIGAMTPALERMSEAQRASYLLHVFGTEALAGVNAIMAQVTHGVRTNTGETLRGAAAVAYLRKQFEEAGGTAAGFRDKLLDTLEGQKKLLRGSMETLEILVGEIFSKAIKPIVAGIIRVVNAVIDVVHGIPEPVRNLIARVVLAGGALLTLLGGFIAAKAAIALVGSALSAIGVTLAGIASAMLPVIALFALLSLVVAGFAVAFERDIGGIGSFFKRTWAQISLLLRGLGQLFQAGGFSGAIMEELNRAENAGVKQFAIRVYQIVYRIQRFFSGIADGFVAAIERARPVFDTFVGQLQQLAAAFGVAGAGAADAIAGLNSDKFAQAGAGVGDVLAMIAVAVVQVFTIVGRVVGGIVEGFQFAYQAMSPVFELVGQAVNFLVDEVRGLIATFKGVSAANDESISGWRLLGDVIGYLAGALVGVLAMAVGVVALALREVVVVGGWVIHGLVSYAQKVMEVGEAIYAFFQRLPTVFRAVASGIKTFFQPVVDFIGGIVDAIQSAIERALGYVGRLAARVPARFRPAFVDDLVQASGGAVGPAAGPAAAPGWFARPAPAEPTLPAAAAVAAQSQLSEQQLDALMSRPYPQADERPIQANVVLNVDGEMLAQASAVASRNVRARSFMPVSEAE